MKIDWLFGRNKAGWTSPVPSPDPPSAPSTQARTQPSPPSAGILFDNVVGTLQEPGLLTVCPHCGESLAKDGTKQPRVRFNTDKVTGAANMYCPHCATELQLSDLRPRVPPPQAAAPVPNEQIGTRAGERAYTGPPIRDLTQGDVLLQLKAHGMTAEEADACVQVAVVMTSTLDPNQISAIYNSRDAIKVKDLALRWAAHCLYHGARPTRLY